tara:strand:+ start:24 stop:1910 length:1887 start_codon:yes stop_codon:yes gene_type:complete
MPYAKYKLIPGINREGTAFSAQGGWFDSNLVRFRKGFPEKIGGWEKEQTNTYLGTGRALHAWVSLGGTKYLSLGTTLKYYVKDGTNFYDITPIRATTSAGDVTFSATNGSSTVTIADTSHGASKGDYVTFSGAASLGGNVTAAVLNQEYSIDSIVNANSYKITAKDTSGSTVTANASDSGNGGSSTVGAYQISVGLDEYVSGSGYGAGAWGDSTFGSASALAFNNQLRIWTHDNFGEDLVINPRAGGIFYWTENNGTSVRAQSLTALGAILPPTVALQVLVSDVDRHVICLGADPLDDAGVARTSVVDPMFIAWSDQENINDWEPTSTNTAGSLRLSAGTQIVGALRSRQEILIWTDDALYSMQFIGPPYTFGVNLINQGVGMVAPKAAVNTPAGVYWMDRSGFYNYNGTVSRVPCSVHNYVFNDFNQNQSFKVFGYLNRQFNEVGWFYPSGNSAEIDRYVVFNYQENVWYYGQMTRFAWLDEGVQPYPRATGTDTHNYVYRHETGNDADGTPMDNVYIESADFSLDGIGNAYTQIQNVIPDVRFLGNGGSDQTVNFVLKTRNYPNESLTTKSTSQVTESTQKVDLRGRARQAVVRLESDDDASTEVRLGVGWRLGDMRLNTRPDGRR